MAEGRVDKSGQQKQGQAEFDTEQGCLFSLALHGIAQSTYQGNALGDRVCQHHGESKHQCEIQKIHKRVIFAEAVCHVYPIQSQPTSLPRPLQV